MTRMGFLKVTLMACLLLVGTRMAQGKNLPALKKQWRVPLTSQGIVGLTTDAARSLSQQKATYFFPQVENEQDPSFFLKGPEQASTWMLTYGGLQGKYQSVEVVIEEGDMGANGDPSSQGWLTVATTPIGQYDYNVATTFPVQPGKWYKVRLKVAAMAKRPLQLYMNNINLFDISGPERKDIWLMLGASIEVQSMNAGTFNSQMKQFYDADPILFTLAQGGWRTTELKAALPGFLAKHPQATFAMIHIGGNNVSAYRPYPGNKEEMEKDLQEILQMLQDKGITPILGRLTYRAYKATDNPRGYPVPGEENGSLPYNTNIYDPLIAKYSPAFYDFKKNQGFVDGYALFKERPDLLLDGIHVSPQGGQSWQQLWVELAGSVVYNKAPACGTTCLYPGLQPAVCGNGLVEVGEECDDGINPTGLCTPSCEPGFSASPAQFSGESRLAVQQQPALLNMVHGGQCQNSTGTTFLPLMGLALLWWATRTLRRPVVQPISRR